MIRNTRKLSGCLQMLIALILVVLAAAQPAAAQSQRNYPFVGVVTGENVYVRVGPGSSYYYVTQLDTGNLVTVRDILTGGYYRIDPLDDTFSYISKAFVDLDDDGETGTVTGDRVAVRAPSPAGPEPRNSYHIQMRLNRGDTVQVIGEESGWYKIKSPEQVRLFIASQFVDRASQQQIDAANQPPEPPEPPEAPESPQSPESDVEDADATTETTEETAEQSPGGETAEDETTQETTQQQEPQADATDDSTMIAQADTAMVDETTEPADATQTMTDQTDGAMDDAQARMDAAINAAEREQDAATAGQTAAQMEGERDAPLIAPPADDAPDTEPATPQAMDDQPQTQPAEPLAPTPMRPETQPTHEPSATESRQPETPQRPATPPAPATPAPTPGNDSVEYAQPVGRGTVPSAPQTPASPASPKVTDPAASPRTAQPGQVVTRIEVITPEREQRQTPTTAIEPRHTPAELALAEADLATLEQMTQSLKDMPLEDQPLEPLIEGYRNLAEDPQIMADTSDAALINHRIELLRLQLDLQNTLLNLNRTQQRVRDMDAQQQTDITDLPIEQLDAVGRLIASPIFDGQSLPLLHRLIDLANGQVIAYVDPAAYPQVTRYLNQIVGIVGESRYDEALKLRVLEPTQMIVLTPQAARQAP